MRDTIWGMAKASEWIAGFNAEVKLPVWSNNPFNGKNMDDDLNPNEIGTGKVKEAKDFSKDDKDYYLKLRSLESRISRVGLPTLAPQGLSRSRQQTLPTYSNSYGVHIKKGQLGVPSTTEYQGSDPSKDLTEL